MLTTHTQNHLIYAFWVIKLIINAKNFVFRLESPVYISGNCFSFLYVVATMYIIVKM